MGFFSWKDCKDGKSVANIYSGHPNSQDTVYLLQPNDKPEIAETAYDGYGVFGGVDAYEWIGRQNQGEEIVGDDPADLRMYGINLDCGKVYMDRNGNYYGDGFGKAYEKLGIKQIEGNYKTVQPDFGKTLNQLTEEGEWKSVNFIDVFKKIYFDLQYVPIKVSYDKDARYEDYESSPRCASQGYFYSDDEIGKAIMQRETALSKSKSATKSKSPKR